MSRVRYTDDFKQHILTEFEAGTPVAKLARDFEPCGATIYKWVRENRPVAEGEQTARSEQAWKEIVEENLYLKRQVAFLKKAATWFAKECETDPGGMRHIG